MIIQADRIVTADGDPIDNGAITIEAGSITAIGPAGADADIIHHGLVTPGLIDAHTHAVWVGSRAGEYVMRMQGADYETIAQAGGGIVASMRAIRQASLEELSDALAARLRRMATLGVTTVEVKSGYGLSEKDERRQLEAIARVAERSDIPRVAATFLGLHSLPPEAKSRDDYARDVLRWLDPIARDGLAQWVDTYIDRSAFSVAQARPILERARALGLGVRVHIGQFADVGGAALAADVGAASADHLEHISPEGAAQLAEAGTHAVLLPLASFTLKQQPPPVALFRQAGVKLVVASDANPGTAPSESLPLAMAHAAVSYGLTAAEILNGVTRHAASSLKSNAGVLRPGAPADLVLWDLAHETELLQPWGVRRAQAVYRDGVSIA